MEVQSAPLSRLYSIPDLPKVLLGLELHVQVP